MGTLVVALGGVARYGLDVVACGGVARCGLGTVAHGGIRLVRSRYGHPIIAFDRQILQFIDKTYLFRTSRRLRLHSPHPLPTPGELS